jgi:hypothetical protein
MDKEPSGASQQQAAATIGMTMQTTKALYFSLSWIKMRN